MEGAHIIAASPGSTIRASSFTTVTGTGVPGSKVRGITASSHGTFLDILRAQEAVLS